MLPRGCLLGWVSLYLESFELYVLLRYEHIWSDSDPTVDKVMRCNYKQFRGPVRSVPLGGAINVAMMCLKAGWVAGYEYLRDSEWIPNTSQLEQQIWLEHEHLIYPAVVGAYYQVLRTVASVVRLYVVDLSNMSLLFTGYDYIPRKYDEIRSILIDRDDDVGATLVYRINCSVWQNDVWYNVLRAVNRNKPKILAWMISNLVVTPFGLQTRGCGRTYGIPTGKLWKLLQYAVRSDAPHTFALLLRFNFDYPRADERSRSTNLTTEQHWRWFGFLTAEENSHYHSLQCKRTILAKSEMRQMEWTAIQRRTARLFKRAQKTVIDGILPRTNWELTVLQVQQLALLAASSNAKKCLTLLFNHAKHDLLPILTTLEYTANKRKHLGSVKLIQSHN